MRDGNGSEYLLCEDAEGNDYYTLVGFYDTVKAGDPLAPVAGYTIPKTYNDIPIKAIGEAVFNANAYANEDVANWLESTVTAVIVGIMNIAEDQTVTWSDNNVTSIGNYNFVGMTACAQLLAAHCHYKCNLGRVLCRFECCNIHPCTARR